MGDFHRDDLHGFESLGVAAGAAGGPDVTTLIDTWSAMAALDGVLDDGADLHGGRRRRLPGVHARCDRQLGHRSDVQLPRCATERFRLRPGAERLRTVPEREAHPGHLLRRRRGAAIAPARVDGGRRPGRSAGRRGALRRDGGQPRPIDRPGGRRFRPARPQLTFDADWSLEEGFDYGYVQVSTDGGDSYETIPCSDQVDGPLGSAYNGESDAFLPESCDLSAFAGQTVVLAFRMVTDSSVHFDGFWVDDVAIGGTVLSDGSTLDGWSSPTEFNPIDVEGYTVRVIAYDTSGTTWLTGRGHGHGHVGDAWIATVHAQQPTSPASSRAGALRQAIGTKADVVSVHRDVPRLHGAGAAIRAVPALTVNGWSAAWRIDQRAMSGSGHADRSRSTRGDAGRVGRAKLARWLIASRSSRGTASARRSRPRPGWSWTPRTATSSGSTPSPAREPWSRTARSCPSRRSTRSAIAASR